MPNISISLSDEKIKALDAKRGQTSRSAFIASFIDSAQGNGPTAETASKNASKLYHFRLGQSYEQPLMNQTNISEFIRLAILEWRNVLESLSPEAKAKISYQATIQEKTIPHSVSISDPAICDYLDSIGNRSEFLRKVVETKIDTDTALLEMQSEPKNNLFDHIKPKPDTTMTDLIGKLDE
ncbi:MAG: hypothetical protein ACYCPW_03760 [Nitrososphaerales archaeon]